MTRDWVKNQLSTNNIALNHENDRKMYNELGKSNYWIVVQQAEVSLPPILKYYGPDVELALDAFLD